MARRKLLVSDVARRNRTKKKRSGKLSDGITAPEYISQIGRVWVSSSYTRGDD
jgi:hypothetical protein